MVKKIDPDSPEMEILVQRGLRLKKARELVNIPKNQLAQLAGVNPNSVTYWEKASEYPRALARRTAVKVASALTTLGLVISPEWLYDGIGEPPYMLTRSEIPEKNYFHSTTDSDAIQEALENTGIELGKKLSIKTELFQIEDDTMEPHIKCGDYILVTPVPDDLWDTMVGKPCLARLENNALYCRVLLLSLIHI